MAIVHFRNGQTLSIEDKMASIIAKKVLDKNILCQWQIAADEKGTFKFMFNMNEVNFIK